VQSSVPVVDVDVDPELRLLVGGTQPPPGLERLAQQRQRVGRLTLGEANDALCGGCHGGHHGRRMRVGGGPKFCRRGARAVEVARRDREVHGGEQQLRPPEAIRRDPEHAPDRGDRGVGFVLRLPEERQPGLWLASELGRGPVRCSAPAASPRRRKML
jgi:hypothetical protein